MNNYDYELCKLSNKFRADYPSCDYPEIMSKEARPYLYALVSTNYGYYLAIPYRTNIRHGNAYLFKNTLRSKNNRSGLDFSKMVIIEDPAYIDTDSKLIIDKDEYDATVHSSTKIITKAVKYLNGYIKTKGRSPKYTYSTLKYFDNIIFKSYM